MPPSPSATKRWIVCITFGLLNLQSSHAADLSDGLLANVGARLAEAAQLSWELGTRAQAILEYNASTYSVLNETPLPPPADIRSDVTSSIQPAFDIAERIVANRSTSNNGTQGPQPLIHDGSAADPASIGFVVLLANWTRQGGQDYADAAKDQLEFLYNQVPKTGDGAFSHRVSEVQLWSDFVYMVPPFLAYYGVLSQNRTLLADAYNQIRLYRNYLQDPAAGGLWKHIALGASGVDDGHWSTGNGWAAAGMLRVLGTIKNSKYASSMKNEQNDLANWVKEIHTAMYNNLDKSTLLFTNYADRLANTDNNFYDAASTALLASTVYRLSLIWGEHSHLPDAERVRKGLAAPGPNDTFVHFTDDGWLTPVVNPHMFGQQGEKSAEGQAFVVLMQAAWKDWVDDGSKGANDATGLRVGMGCLWAVLVVSGWNLL